MGNRNPARVLAPLALAAAVVGVLVVVQTSRSGTSAPASTPDRTATVQEERSARPQRRTYVVKPGDTLSLIAEKTGATLEEIERLNPDVDPQALQAGQRLKLSP